MVPYWYWLHRLDPLIYNLDIESFTDEFPCWLEESTPPSGSGKAAKQTAGFQGPIQYTHRQGWQKGEYKGRRSWGTMEKGKAVNHMVTEGD